MVSTGGYTILSYKLPTLETISIHLFGVLIQTEATKTLITNFLKHSVVPKKITAQEMLHIVHCHSSPDPNAIIHVPCKARIIGCAFVLTINFQTFTIKMDITKVQKTSSFRILRYCSFVILMCFLSMRHHHLPLIKVVKSQENTKIKSTSMHSLNHSSSPGPYYISVYHSIHPSSQIKFPQNLLEKSNALGLSL